jgi:glycosyltransferase involved in cell wall biosynthesis
MDNAKTKIAIISHSLGNGGAERFAGELSLILNDLHYEPHLIVVNDEVDYPFSGKLYNLGQLCQANAGIFKRIRKGFLLRNYLQSENIDIIIDNRTRNNLLRECFTSMIYGNRKVYFMIHSYYLENYLPKSVFFAKRLYQNAEKMICVSKAIEEKVTDYYGLNNTITIYNPVKEITVTSTNTKLPKDFILFYGRLEAHVKNFSLMLQAFFESKVYEKGIHLVILGDGSSKKSILATIEKLQLQESVHLIPFQKDPFAYVSQAKFTLLTSHYEGFPMSIIESLSLGIPVVSVDCNSGPREIIQNEYNGLLVENHNPTALSNAMNRLVEDELLYAKLKSNAKISVAHLSTENISKQWEALLKK